MHYNKTVLITGAAKRIGASIAKSMSQDGWRILVHYNNSQKEAFDLCKELNQDNIVAYPIQADLNTPTKLWKEIPDKFKPVTCLINNASVFQYDTIESVTFEKWQEHLLPNLWAPIFLSQQFAKNLPKKCRGNIINIIDQRVLNLTPHFLSYTISKAGLLTITKTLALSLAPFIRVNGIGPGPTLVSHNQTKKAFQSQRTQLPLGHGPNLQEINQAVRFILQTNSLTGQMIAIDSGQHLGWKF